MLYPVNSSGRRTATAQVSSNPGFLAGLDMISPTTGTATLTIYDSKDSNTSGKTIIAEMEVDAGMPSCNHEYANMVIANQGLYIVLEDVSGTASYIARFAIT